MSTRLADRLGVEKLRAEIRKLTAEAETAELARDVARRERAEADADADLHHVYTFVGDVEAETVQPCIEQLSKWARRDLGCPITLVLNSPGGLVIEGLALYDFLRTLSRSGHEITTIARGQAASMAGVLLQAGDVRLVDPNAHILIHEVSSGTYGKLSEMDDRIAFAKRLQDRLLAILSDRSTLSVEQIRRKWRKTDWWLNADEAVALGFVDRVGS